MADKKKVPLGKLPPESDEELERDAQVTEEDIEKAKKFWRQHAPDKFVTLLDAEKIEDES